MGLTIDVFTANSVFCTPVVKVIEETACANCDVVVHDMREDVCSQESLEKAAQYGITRFPAVAINGELADCCSHQEPLTRDTLLAAVRRRSVR